MRNVYGYFHTVEKNYTFIVHLAMVLGGLISMGWLAGSLFLYWRLDRPIWELTCLVAVSLFAISCFCVREFSRRSPTASAGKPVACLPFHCSLYRHPPKIAHPSPFRIKGSCLGESAIGGFSFSQSLLYEASAP